MPDGGTTTPSTPTTPNITLFTDETPTLRLMSQIFNPATGTGNIIPYVGSLVIDLANNGNLYFVESVDPQTRITTFQPARMLLSSQSSSFYQDLESTVDYGNAIFRCFYDPRTKPLSLTIDNHMKLLGTNLAEYELVRYPGTPNEKVISLLYDPSGKLAGSRIPLFPINPNLKTVFGCQDCFTTEVLNPDEQLRLDAYNCYGALTSTTTLFAKQSTIVNENNSQKAVIVGMTIGSTQLRGNNEIYIYEQQDVGSLGITVTLTYDNGYSHTLDIDYKRCFLYGLENFIASYPGLTQELVVKYFLGPDQLISKALLAVSETHLTSSINLVVVPNSLAPKIKLSVIPQWIAALSKYVLHYFAYSLDKNTVTDVTQYITPTKGSFDGGAYGVLQDFAISVDLFKVDPTVYPEPTLYQQEIIITLQPVSIYERYIFRDGVSSLYVYGADTPTARRPVLYFDDNLQQYFIPTSLFPTSDSFLQSFYLYNSPLFDTSVQTAPTTPTHFILRDIATGLSIVPAPIPIAEYSAAFSIAGTGAPNRYCGMNVVLEFLDQINTNQTLILFGSPVDCYLSTTGYQAPH